MAFTLKIKARALLGPKKTDIDALLKSCGMAYGNTNEFYILEQAQEFGHCTNLDGLETMAASIQ